MIKFILKAIVLMHIIIAAIILKDIYEDLFSPTDEKTRIYSLRNLLDEISKEGRE